MEEIRSKDYEGRAEEDVEYGHGDGTRWGRRTTDAVTRTNGEV